MFKNIFNFHFSDKTINYTILFVAFLEIIYLTTRVFAWQGLYLDELEHIHASWLVWNGQVPYRDFFEHHHPLLWFIFAPITGLFFDNADIFYIGRFWAICTGLLTWYFIYKIITEFIANSKAFLVCAALVLSIMTFTHSLLVEFRPDNFMYLCFWSGLYYYFAFLRTSATPKLAVSFSLFTLSILFLQKIIVLLFFLGLYTLYMLIKKQIRWRNIWIAIPVPLGIIILFIAYLALTGSLKQYWILNFELNSLIPQFYGLTSYVDNLFDTYVYIPMNNGYNSVRLPPSIICMCGFTLIVISFFVSKNTPYRTCLVVLFFSELATRGFLFSPFPHYFYLLNILCGIIIGTSLLERKNQIINIFLSLSVVFYLFSLIIGIQENLCNRDQTKSIVSELQYVIDNTNHNERLLNGQTHLFNLFRRDTDYMWFSLNNVGYIYNLVYQNNFFDINRHILETKPKFIYVQNTDVSYYYYRASAVRKFNLDLQALNRLYPNKNINISDFIVQIPDMTYPQIDPTIIEKYYIPSPYEQLYILKDEK